MDNSSLYSCFLKALHLHVPHQKKCHCGGKRRRSILLIGLFWISNSCIIKKWNTWSKPYTHIPFTHFHVYFLFLHTWDARLALWDSHIDVNWHLSNTWLLWFFSKLDYWTSSASGLPLFSLVSSLLLSLVDWFCCVAVLMLASPAYLQWVGLYLIIWLESISQNFQKSKMFPSFHVW